MPAAIRRLGVSVRQACDRAAAAELSINRYASDAYRSLPRA